MRNRLYLLYLLHTRPNTRFIIVGESEEKVEKEMNEIRQLLKGEKMFGIVKTMVVDKGYGFIKADNGSEYFMHKTAVVDGTPWEGNMRGKRVEFEIEGSDKGPRAKEVCFN